MSSLDCSYLLFLALSFSHSPGSSPSFPPLSCSLSLSSSADPSVSTMSTDKTREMLEDENDRLVDEMAQKIDTLKKVRTCECDRR